MPEQRLREATSLIVTPGLQHLERGGRVTVPVHSGKTIGPGLLGSILAQARLTADEFRAALWEDDGSAHLHGRGRTR